MYQPQGGILASERCILAHVAAAKAVGAELREQESVLTWEEDSGTGVLRVVTDKGAYTADRLIMTAGSWIGELVKPLQVRQPQVDAGSGSCLS